MNIFPQLTKDLQNYKKKHYNKFPLSQKYESRRGGGQKYESL